MRSYSDIIKALDDANKILLSIENVDELVISTNYARFSLYSKNRITEIKTIILDDADREVGYRWIEGFITALLIARPTILENNNDDTRRSEEKTLVSTKIHLSWFDQFKRWF